MPFYRLFIVDQSDRVGAPPEFVECADDQAALARANQKLDGHVIEVWNLSRRVGRLVPGGLRATTSPPPPLEVAPLTISCVSCGSPAMLALMLPDEIGAIYSYNCPAGHRSEYIVAYKRENVQ